MTGKNRQDDSQDPTSSDFMHQWLTSQQRFWQTLGQGLDTSTHSSNQHSSSQAETKTEKEPDATAQSHAGTHSHWQDTLVEHNRQLAELGQQLLEALQQQTDQAAVQQPSLQQQLAELFIKHLRRSARLQSIDQWQLPPAIAQGLKNLLGEQDFMDAATLSRFPFLQQAFGQRHQHYQHQGQALLHAWQDFTEAYTAYSAQEDQLFQQCSEQFTMALENQPLQQLDELFQLWADIYDRLHLEQLENTTYQAAYGKLLNAALELRQQSQSMAAAEDYRALGLVPLSDYQTLLKQQHQLRKQQRRQQQQIGTLEQRLNELEQRLAAKESDST